MAKYRKELVQVSATPLYQVFRNDRPDQAPMTEDEANNWMRQSAEEDNDVAEAEAREEAIDEDGDPEDDEDIDEDDDYDPEDDEVFEEL